MKRHFRSLVPNRICTLLVFWNIAGLRSRFAGLWFWAGAGGRTFLFRRRLWLRSGRCRWFGSRSLTGVGGAGRRARSFTVGACRRPADEGDAFGVTGTGDFQLNFDFAAALGGVSDVDTADHVARNILAAILSRDGEVVRPGKVVLDGDG